VTEPSDLLAAVLYRFAAADVVRKHQRSTVKLFTDLPAGKVLDVACGRGIFLELLRDAGIEATGVDGHPDSVAECHDKGFPDVTQGDVLEFLRARVADGSRYAAVFCSHIIEHLPGDRALELVASSANVLAPGGRFVVITPNVANPVVWQGGFWLDPTHVRPYPRRLLAALMEAAGLEVVRSYNDPGTRRPFLAIVPTLVRYGLGGLEGQDAIVVGRKPA